MRPDLQRAFIGRVTDVSYDLFRKELQASLGMEIAFRICEMPIFVSHDFRRDLESAAVEIIQQCIRPTYLAKTDRTLTPETTVRNENDRPLFSVVDFAVCQNEQGDWVPKLIELQGFPSLFGYQYLYASRMREAYEMWETTPFFSELDHERYVDLLRESIFGAHSPEVVALLEVDPEAQKTRPDFVAMEQLIGLRTVNIRHVVKNGRELFVRSDDGSLSPLKRIFNRAIVDELNDLGVEL
ncbi:MAG TPA: hypothetical protein VK147_09470, partial [Candidatus Didemnitutus sp.]|nr:hypothetical protein [Candidatus Didemnitutus sp.]